MYRSRPAFGMITTAPLCSRIWRERIFPEGILTSQSTRQTGPFEKITFRFLTLNFFFILQFNPKEVVRSSRKAPMDNRDGVRAFELRKQGGLRGGCGLLSCTEFGTDHVQELTDFNLPGAQIPVFSKSDGNERILGNLLGAFKKYFPYSAHVFGINGPGKRLNSIGELLFYLDQELIKLTFLNKAQARAGSLKITCEGAFNLTPISLGARHDNPGILPYPV